MNDKEFDVLLEEYGKKNYPKQEFSSKDEFQKKFFRKTAEQSPQAKTHLVFWKYTAWGLCAMAVLAIGIQIFKPLPASKNGKPATVEAPVVQNVEPTKPTAPAPAPVQQAAQETHLMALNDAIAGTALQQEVAAATAAAPVERNRQMEPPRTTKAKMAGQKLGHAVLSEAVNNACIRVVPSPKFNTEEYKTYEENPFLEVKNNPLSTFGADVDTASYTNLRRILQSGRWPERDAVRTEELLNYFNYDYPAPKKNEKFTVHFEMMDAPWNTGHKLLLIGVQAKKLDVKKLPASNIVFLIDNSGSMNSYMDLVRESMSLLADSVRSKDRISIVTYGGGVHTLLEGVNGKEKTEIKNAIGKIMSGGYTPGNAGIQRAYELAHKHFIEGGNNRIVLITDGDFNVGASSESELVAMVEKERQSAIYLTAIGVGMGNYKDNKLKMLANKGNGNYLYWDSMAEARNSLVNEMSGNMFTLAKDVKFQIEMNPAKIHSYRQLGYEMRQLADRDFNDDSKDSGEVGVGQQLTVLYELVMADGKNSSEVDPLKYQKTKALGNAEILTCKLRYQEPEGNQVSVLKTFVLKAVPKAENNVRWAANVAEFAMILRDSAHKGNADLATLRKRSQPNLGEDQNGKRIDFLNMIRTAENLKNPSNASADADEEAE